MTRHLAFCGPDCYACKLDRDRREERAAIGNVDARFTGGPLDGHVRPIWAACEIYQVYATRSERHTYRRTGASVRDGDGTVLGLHFAYVGLVPR